MGKVQYAQQQEPAPASETTPRVAKPEQLSLPELIRIMDVATALRKRLLEAAKVSGEAVTAEQIDAAIEDYYDKLHKFEEPEWSLQVLLAKLYVHRITIIKWGLAIGAVLAWVWGM
jgi:hypothetical protein